MALEPALSLLLLVVGLVVWIDAALVRRAAVAAVLSRCGWCSRARGRLALAATRIGIASLPQRWGASSVIVVGIAGVVGVLVAMLAMGEGFEATLKQTGSDDTAIILRGGSQAETNSVITRDQVPLIAHAGRHRARTPTASRSLSPELSQVVNLPTARPTATTPTCSCAASARRPGRCVRRSRSSKAASSTPACASWWSARARRSQFRGLEVGKQIKLGNQLWTVVGVFASGDAHDRNCGPTSRRSASAYRPPARYQSVTVKLRTARTASTSFKAALAGDPRLKLDVQTTRDYYAKQSEGLTKLIRILGT